MPFTRYFLALLLLFLSPASFASTLEYPRQMIFQNIMENQEVALGEVEAILQDHEGFMWFGGRNDLLRYDGHQLAAIPTQTEDKGEIQLSNTFQVVCIFEDRHQRMWVGTRHGLYFYDRQLEVLKKVQTDIEVIDNTSINALAESANDQLLIGSYQGLFELNPNSHSAHKVMVRNDVQNTLGIETFDILVRKNTVWLGTRIGLVSLDWDKKISSLHIPFPEKPDSLPENSIQSLGFDRHGNIWAGVATGIFQFEPNTQAFKYFTPGDLNRIGSGIIRDIHLDTKGFLWIATDSEGLSLYDENLDRFIRFQNDLGDASSISSNNVRSIGEDRQGDLWFGTYPSGVNFHDRASTAVRVLKNIANNDQSLLHTNVEALSEDAQGRLWVGVETGLTVYDRENENYKHYDITRGNSPTNAIISSFIDSDGEIWLGTWANGLLRYDPVQDQLVQIPFDPAGTKDQSVTTKQLNDAYVWQIYEDKNKTLWVSTHNGGLSKFNKHTGEFTNIISVGSDKNSLTSNLVWGAYEDSKGRFWVGTAGGLSLLDRSTGKAKQYTPNSQQAGSLVNGSILSIHEDKRGRLWFGTDGGLHLYHENSDSFSVFGVQDGFADNGIRSIIEDPQGNLWMGTNKGIVKFNADSKAVENFEKFNAENIGGLDTQVALVSTKGELIFGGQKGLRIYNVQGMEINGQAPPVVFTELDLFARPVEINDNTGLLQQAINQTEQLVFNYQQNMFAIHFAALSFRNPDKNQYAYKLEGFDKEWRKVGNKNQALYTNLSAGEYTFRVKASNNDGVWNEQGKALTIRQLPPPWLTWWAKTFYALCVLAVIVQFVRSQKRKREMVEQQNRILEVKVAERTAELQEKNQDIQTMLGNMQQGLFTIDQSGKIHHEYSIYLESIFETQNIAGQNAFDLLFSESDAGVNEVNQVQEAIHAVLGSLEMFFEFNKHLLITEYVTRIGNQTKYLQLDWSPIVKDSLVDKLMVSVRDVTKIKQLEDEAKHQQMELKIISQLLNINSSKFMNFIESSKQHIALSQEKINHSDTSSAEVYAYLYRNMHSIKGAARTFGFSLISDAAHESETLYSTLKTQNETWSAHTLLDQLDKLEAILEKYLHIYSSVLRRGDESSSRDKHGIWLNEQSCLTILQRIENLCSRFPGLSNDQDMLPLNELINTGISASLKEVLSDIVQAIPSIAHQLDKETPAINIIDHGIHIKNADQNVIGNVFTHLLRNCVDHGIEQPQERLTKGKSPQGTITIEANINAESSYISIQDDGRGLDFEKLFHKGIELGLWKSEDKPEPQHIADLVFESGVSTKDQVTDISGRGAGMDAVKQFMIEAGGNAEIKLLDSPGEQNLKTGASHWPFQIILTLPKASYIHNPSRKTG